MGFYKSLAIMFLEYLSLHDWAVVESLDVLHVYACSVYGVIAHVCYQVFSSYSTSMGLGKSLLEL